MKISLINNKTRNIYTLSGVSEVELRSDYIDVVFNKMNLKNLANFAADIQEVCLGSSCVDFYPSQNNYRIHFREKNSYSFYRCQEEFN
jgi:hypothetical protein